MLNCSFVGVIRPTLFYTGIGQTPCSYEHYFVIKHFEKRYTDFVKIGQKVSFDKVKVIPLNGKRFN